MMAVHRRRLPRGEACHDQPEPALGVDMEHPAGQPRASRPGLPLLAQDRYNAAMSAARDTSFWWFQLAFWLIAGSALFISGLSQTEPFPALVRNLFLTIAGFLTSFFLTTVIDRLRHMDELRLRLVTFPVGYAVALMCVVTINAISFTQHGYAYADIDREDIAVVQKIVADRVKLPIRIRATLVPAIVEDVGPETREAKAAPPGSDP